MVRYRNDRPHRAQQQQPSASTPSRVNRSGNIQANTVARPTIGAQNHAHTSGARADRRQANNDDSERQKRKRERKEVRRVERRMERRERQDQHTSAKSVARTERWVNETAETARPDVFGIPPSLVTSSATSKTSTRHESNHLPPPPESMSNTSSRAEQPSAVNNSEDAESDCITASEEDIQLRRLQARRLCDASRLLPDGTVSSQGENTFPVSPMSKHGHESKHSSVGTARSEGFPIRCRSVSENGSEQTAPSQSLVVDSQSIGRGRDDRNSPLNNA